MLTNSIIEDIKYQFRYGNAAIKLIFANCAVFVILGILKLSCYIAQDPAIYTWLANELKVPAAIPALLRQPWSVFTYMFLHEGLLHILFNMLWLYWFSEIVILFLGDKKILPLYIFGGLAGAGIYIAAYSLIPVFKIDAAHSLMAGASASVLAIVWGAVALSPDYEMQIFTFRVKLKYVAIIPLVLDIINIPNGNAGGYIAHIGGAIMGYTYIKVLQGGTDLASPFAAIGNIFKRKPKVKLTHKSESRSPNPSSRTDDVQRRVDEILDKMLSSGYDGLTKEEKDYLFHYSKEK